MKRIQPPLAPPPVLNNAVPAQDEGSRAQHWRQVIMGLSIKELSELTGYSVTAIRCFEANANTAGELFGENAWRRYRMTCLGVVLDKHPNIIVQLYGSAHGWPALEKDDAREQR